MGFFRDLFEDSTAGPFVDSTAGTRANDSFSSSAAYAIGTAMLYFGGAYVSITADATYPSLGIAEGIADTASMNAGIETVNSVVGGTYEGSASVSGEDSAALAMFSPVIATTSAGVAGVTGVSGESSGGEEIIAIIFRRDAMPYSRVEKRAEKIFSQLHKGGEKTEKFPTIIAQNQETYDAFLPIYGNSIKSLRENLEIMEAALRNESSN